MSIFVIGNDGCESASGFAVMLHFAPMARILNVEFKYRLEDLSQKVHKMIEFGVFNYGIRNYHLFNVNIVLNAYIV